MVTWWFEILFQNVSMIIKSINLMKFTCSTLLLYTLYHQHYPSLFLNIYESNKFQSTYKITTKSNSNFSYKLRIINFIEHFLISILTNFLSKAIWNALHLTKCDKLQYKTNEIFRYKLSKTTPMKSFGANSPQNNPKVHSIQIIKYSEQNEIYLIPFKSMYNTNVLLYNTLNKSKYCNDWLAIHIICSATLVGIRFPKLHSVYLLRI